MASIINASSTGSGGIVQTADASGALQLQSNGTVGITVNTSGYVAFRDATVGTTALTLRAIANTYAGGALALQDAAGTSKTYISSIASATFFGDNTSVDCATINQYGLGIGGTLGTSGLGITFPATQSASSNANTLDDYEEGTWTPTYSTTGATITYAFQSGYYIKIGRMVYVTWDLGTASVTVTDGSAQVNVGGLPFTASGSVASNGIVNQANNWASNNPNCCLVAVGASVMQIGPTNFIQNSASYCSYLNTTTAQRNETHGTLMYYANS